MRRRGGRAALVVLGLAWSLPGAAGAREGDIRIGVAPLEVHGVASSVESAAKEVRSALVQELGEVSGLSAVAAPKDSGDSTLEPLSDEALRNAAGTSRASYVVYGSITQLGGTYSFDARLFDPNVGKAKAAFFREGAGREDLVAKLSDLALEIGKVVEPPKLPPAGAEAGDTDAGQVSRGMADSSMGESGTGTGAGEAGTATDAPGREEAKSNPLGLRVRDNKTPIAISSETLEAINKENTVVFRGNVEAKQSGLQIYCEVMTVIYSADGKGIVKIIADRNVRIIHQGTAGDSPASGTITATCNRGIYHNAEGRIDLTGNPVVKRGNDTVRGDQISVYLDDNRFTVRQAKVTISPEGMQALDKGSGPEGALPGGGE